MATIIAGRFDSFGQAQTAKRGLIDRGFRGDDVQVMYVNPPGQHAATPIGGDVDADAGSKFAHRGALAGIALGAGVGLLVGLLLAQVVNLGPAMIVICTGVGAFGGQVLGAFTRLEDSRKARVGATPATRAERAAGVLIATRVDEHRAEDAVEVLKRSGAADIEKTNGNGTVASGSISTRLSRHRQKMSDAAVKTSGHDGGRRASQQSASLVPC